jgi:hypothetical protein
VRQGVEAAWNGIDDLTDEAGDQAIAQVVPLVGGAQLNTAALHAAYMSDVVGFVMHTPAVATLIAEATWNRSPLIQARRLMSEGFDQDEALAQAALRAAQVHSGDVLRARGDAIEALSYGTEPIRPVRWSKVPLPDACEWCRLVSTRLYRSQKLPAHLHDRCGLDAVSPAEAGAFTNASTVFSSNDAYRWRSRVQSSDVAETQRRTAERARELADAATARMTDFPQAA